MNEIERLLQRRAFGQTVLGKTVETSVEVHGIFIPVNEVLSRLHVFGLNLAHYTRVEGFEVQLLGSATGLNYRGRRFLVCTQHQFRNCEPQNVGIVAAGVNLLITSAGIAHFTRRREQADEDRYDLCAFNFSPQTDAQPRLLQRFFKLGASDFLNDGDDPFAYLAYGCAFGDQKVDIYDEQRIGTVIRSLLCEPAPSNAGPELRACKLLSAMDFDPDGFCGGPVFAIVLEGRKPRLKFAGVINRGGGGLFHFIPAGEVRRLLDYILNTG